MEKIGSLKGKDISLPDHVGMAAKKRAEAKAKRLAERQAVAKGNKEKEALWKDRRYQLVVKKRLNKKNPNSLIAIGIFLSAL